MYAIVGTGALGLGAQLRWPPAVLWLLELLDREQETDGPEEHVCKACWAEVWNDHTFPNNGYVILTARELGLRELPEALMQYDGEVVCVVCRNRFSSEFGDGNTV